MEDDAGTEVAHYGRSTIAPDDLSSEHWGFIPPFSNAEVTVHRSDGIRDRFLAWASQAEDGRIFQHTYFATLRESGALTIWERVPVGSVEGRQITTYAAQAWIRVDGDVRE